jgi:hypothetical protein
MNLHNYKIVHLNHKQQNIVKVQNGPMYVIVISKYKD